MEQGSVRTIGFFSHLFRMPLNSKKETGVPNPLDALDDAVVSPGDRPKPLAGLVDGLMMGAIGFNDVRTHHGAKQAARLDPDRMGNVIRWDPPSMDQGRLGKGCKDVLVQRAAEGHVDDLTAPANPQDRNVELEGAATQADIERCPGSFGWFQHGMRGLAEKRGIEVRPSRQNETLGRLQARIEGLRIVKGRKQKRRASGRQNRIQVGIGDLSLEIAFGGSAGTGSDSDSRAIWHERPASWPHQKGTFPPGDKRFLVEAVFRAKREFF